MTGRGVNQNSQAMVICIAPDVCLTPMGSSSVPVPYNISASFGDALETVGTVTFGGMPSFTMGSHIPTVTGDEAGVDGGVISGVNLGYVHPIEHSSTITIGGQAVIRHGDLMHMNAASPTGNGNTYGRIVYASPSSVSNGPPSNATVTTDHTTGKIEIVERGVGTDPETGEPSAWTRKTIVDPNSGTVETAAQKSIDNSETGESTNVEEWGSFDAANGNFEFEQRTSTSPIGPTEIEPAAPGSPDDFSPEPVDTSELDAALAQQAQLDQEMGAINEEMILIGLETAADIAGIVDPSPASDTIAGAIALKRGDYGGAALSVLSWIPYLGDAIAKPLKGTRLAAKVATLAKKLKKLEARAQKAKDTVKRAKKAIAEAMAEAAKRAKKAKDDLAERLFKKKKVDSPSDGTSVPGAEGAKPFDVGPHKDQQGTLPDYDSHHAGQAKGMERIANEQGVPYDRETAPTILVPREGHTIRLPGKAKCLARSHKHFKNARDLLARDIRELRRVYPDIPVKQLRKLVEANKKAFPSLFKK